jgi:hypothetical protein
MVVRVLEPMSPKARGLPQPRRPAWMAGGVRPSRVRFVLWCTVLTTFTDGPCRLPWSGAARLRVYGKSSCCCWCSSTERTQITVMSFITPGRHGSKLNSWIPAVSLVVTAPSNQFSKIFLILLHPALKGLKVLINCCVWLSTVLISGRGGVEKQSQFSLNHLFLSALSGPPWSSSFTKSRIFFSYKFKGFSFA